MTCPPPCGLPTPNPNNYKYTITAQVPGYGHSFTGYNQVDNYSGYGFDNNNSVQYAGTLVANPNAPSYSSTHTLYGKTVSGSINLPVITGDTHFAVTDSNGVVHNISVNGSTVTDVTNLAQGGQWTVSVTTTDGLNWTVSWSNSVPQSGTYNYQLPAALYHQHIGEIDLGTLAYDPSVLVDGSDKPVRIAQRPCCMCINDAALVATLGGIAMGAMAIAFPEILGLEVGLAIFGYGGAYMA